MDDLTHGPIRAIALSRWAAEVRDEIGTAAESEQPDPQALAAS